MDNIKQLQKEISKLTANKERLENLLDMLPSMIVETDLQGNLVYCNQKTFELMGYTVEDLKNGLNATDFVIPEERSLVGQNMQRVMKGESFQGNEYTGLRKDGTAFPVLVYSSHKIKDGGTSGIRAIIIDISERKKEELIREALVEKLQKALEEIKSLEGIIPICMHCKQIRDDEGFWHRVETYIESHSNAKFSHSICLDCASKHYPDFCNDND